MCVRGGTSTYMVSEIGFEIKILSGNFNSILNIVEI